MKNYRAKRASAEDKAKRNEYKKNQSGKTTAKDKAKHNKCNRKRKRGKTSAEHKAKHNKYMKQYRAKKSNCDNNIEKSILLHKIISRGPMSICTCCVQLHQHVVQTQCQTC